MTNFELTSTRTVQYHPDKVSSSEARPAAEAYYVHLKLARDILSDPAKRFAYDRFGLDMIQWRHCTTVRDYVMTGVQTIAPYYVGGGLFMMILGFLGYLEWGRYVCLHHPSSRLTLLTYDFVSGATSRSFLSPCSNSIP